MLFFLCFIQAKVRKILRNIWSQTCLEICILGAQSIPHFKNFISKTIPQWSEWNSNSGTQAYLNISCFFFIMSLVFPSHTAYLFFSWQKCNYQFRDRATFLAIAQQAQQPLHLHHLPNIFTVDMFLSTRSQSKWLVFPLFPKSEVGAFLHTGFFLGKNACSWISLYFQALFSASHFSTLTDGQLCQRKGYGPPAEQLLKQMQQQAVPYGLLLAPGLQIYHLITYT